MKKLREEFRRIGAICLTAVMLVTQTPVMAFAAAEKLSVETDGDTAIVETDGFSFYTVEFTYDSKQYVLSGDSEVALSEILEAVGLSGEASAVEVSDSSLFSAAKNEDGKWIVMAHQAFDTEEWMKVTINGVEYEITVTDDQETENMTWSELQTLLDSASTDKNTPTLITLIGDVTAGTSDTALVVPAGRTVTLDLNGHTINRGLKNSSSRADGNVIVVYGNLTLTDSSADGTGRLTGGNNQDEGGGVFIDQNATFTMEGGSITDCITNSQGGGVNVNGTFNMTGGTISGCTANSGAGGGVKVSKGTFNMTGGTISGCIGRGVFVDSGATFTMRGGSIAGCTNYSGGGVYVNGGTFTMEGSARITGCTATNDADDAQGGGGVYVFGGTFNVSGSPVISGNKKGDKTNNVVLNGSKTITVTGALTSGAEIHINAGKGTTVAEKGDSRTDPLTETEAGYFKNDVDSTLLGGLNDAGQVVLKEPLPALTGASNLIYNGTEQTPELTFSGDPAPALTAGTDYTVSYKKVVGDTETALSGAPKDAGSYKAVAAGKGSYAGTSEASFTIAPKPVTVGGIKAKNKVYDATTTAELDCSGATFAGKVDGDRLTVTATGAFEDANADKAKTVTISGLTLGGGSAGNYALTVTGNQETTTATITRATPEVTAPTASATYMENLSIVRLNNPTGNLSGTWTWATDNGINPNETEVGAVGTHVFRAKFTPTDTANYCETTKDVTVTVGKATPHLTIESFSAPYGHPVSAKSTCNSDGKVTYVFYKSGSQTKTNTEDGAETEGGPPRNAGKYDIVASVAETSNYLSREETLADGCVITPAPNPVVLRSTVTVKRGSDYDLSGLVSDAKGTVSFALNGLPAGYSLSGSTLTLDSNAADSCTITVTADGTVDGKSNYETFSGEITVNATNLDPQDSFGFADVAQEKTYGDGDFTVAATGAETGSNVTYSSSNPQVATVEEDTGKVHILKVGEATITATAGATDTYASATASYKLTVNRKPVTISGITANDLVYNSTIAQGITLNTGGAKIGGKVDGDNLTVSAIGMCDADAGENKTVTIRTITLGGSSAGNYTVDLENSQPTTTINITKAAIPDTEITAPTGKENLVYTGLAQPLVVAGTALGGEMSYAIGTATTAPADKKLYSASIPAAVNAGTYYVWYMVKGDRNHNDSSSSGPVTVTIGKASSVTTINADAVELQKGDNIAASVNIRGYVGTGAEITGTSQVTPNNDPNISIDDIKVSDDKNNLTFKVSSVNGGNAIITVTLTSDNYDSVTLTIPVKVQDRVTEVKLEAPRTGVESSVQSVTVDGLDEYTDSQSGESVKVVLEVESVSSPQDSAVKTKIDDSVKVIFNGVKEGDLKTEYLDISITKQVGTGTANPVGDVERVLELAIKYDLNGKFNHVVIREHEGTVTEFTALNAKPNENYQDGTFYIDEDQGIIYIYSRYFSTYSIAYTTVNYAKITCPVAVENSVYDGTEHALIKAGTATGGEMQYAVGVSDKSAPTTGWSTSIPKATGAGTYYVWYKVVGDDNHSDTTPVSVTVTIGSKAMTVSAADVAAIVDGQPHGVTVNVTDPATGYTVKYGTEAGSYTLDASPTQTEVGTKTVYYQVTADNYTTYTGSVKVTISAKQMQTITASDVTVTYGDTDKKVTAATDGNGAISYAVKEGSRDYIEVDTSTGALTIKKVPADGKAYVTVTAAGTATYEQATKDVTVTINKANAVAATVTANNRTYDGTEKPLVTVTGEPTGGEMQYALGTATEATQPYTTSIPAKTEAGTYYVWYKVDGGDFYESTEAVYVKVTVSAPATSETGEGTNTSGSGEGTNTSGSGEGTNTSGSGESTNTSESGEGTNTSGRGEETNTSGSGESTNTSESGEGTNTSGSGEETNTSGNGSSSNTDNGNSGYTDPGNTNNTGSGTSSGTETDGNGTGTPSGTGTGGSSSGTTSGTDNGTTGTTDKDDKDTGKDKDNKADKDNKDPDTSNTVVTKNEDGSETKTTITQNEDGSETKNTVVTAADGTVTDTSVTTYEDGTVVTEEVAKDADGNTLSTTVETSTVSKKGTVKVVKKTETADGNITTFDGKHKKNGEGSSKSETVDADGKVISTTTETTTVSKKGKTTTTITTENADGSSISTKTVTDKDGNITIKETVKNADNTTTTITGEEKADGTGSRTIVTTDENGKVLSTTEENTTIKSNGTVKVKSTTKNADGSTLTVKTSTTVSGMVYTTITYTDAKGNKTKIKEKIKKTKKGNTKVEIKKTDTTVKKKSTKTTSLSGSVLVGKKGKITGTLIYTAADGKQTEIKVESNLKKLGLEGMEISEIIEFLLQNLIVKK